MAERRQVALWPPPQHCLHPSCPRVAVCSMRACVLRDRWHCSGAVAAGPSADEERLGLEVERLGLELIVVRGVAINAVAVAERQLRRLRRRLDFVFIIEVIVILDEVSAVVAFCVHLCFVFFFDLDLVVKIDLAVAWVPLLFEIGLVFEQIFGVLLVYALVEELLVFSLFVRLDLKLVAELLFFLKLSLDARVLEVLIKVGEVLRSEFGVLTIHHVEVGDLIVCSRGGDHSCGDNASA